MGAEPSPHAKLDKWIWILIYTGLFLVVFGIAAGRAEPAYGWAAALPGAASAIAGVVLIYVRSRLK